MISDKEIDSLLLANSSLIWQKLAKVVGLSMLQVNKQERMNKDDIYFAKRVESLFKKGFLEYKGDLSNMRDCEIRLKETIYQ